MFTCPHLSRLMGRQRWRLVSAADFNSLAQLLIDEGESLSRLYNIVHQAGSRAFGVPGAGDLDRALRGEFREILAHALAEGIVSGTASAKSDLRLIEMPRRPRRSTRLKEAP